MPTIKLKYLTAYPEELTTKVRSLIEQEKLSSAILSRYPKAHDIKTDKALYNYTIDIKNKFLRKSQPLSKVRFDSKLTLTQQALGLHSFVSRVQWNWLLRQCIRLFPPGSPLCSHGTTRF